MEIRKNDDHTPHPALGLIKARPELFVRHGAVIAGWRGCRTRRRGPYYRLCYREGRRLRSIYLGREGPVVEAVRQALAAAQAPWKRWRVYQRQRRGIVASLRGTKTILNRRLRVLGLRLQGYEVRGWRAARRAAAVCQGASGRGGSRTSGAIVATDTAPIES